jgi:hypothetical protein
MSEEDTAGAAGPAACVAIGPGSSCIPGAWELQKPPFQITHKIRQNTANFTGINNVIQSICTSLSHSNW